MRSYIEQTNDPMISATALHFEVPVITRDHKIGASAIVGGEP